MPVNIFITEDESLVRKDIETRLRKLGYEIVGHADRGEAAVELVRATRPDLILMDIKLKGEMSGIEAAGRIKKEMDIPIIYLTANADDATVEKAKYTEPHGYLIKPINSANLRTAVEMAVHKHKRELEVKVENELLKSLSSYKPMAEYLFVKHHSKLTRINAADIYYVEALKDYVIIVTRHLKYTIHATMKDIERKLNKNQFQRVHRSHIVNMDKIESIIGSSVVIQDLGKDITIGGNYKDELANRINVL